MSSSASSNSQRFIPGQMFIESGDIELNIGRKTLSIEVSNSGDRPVQIGSHFHFYEVNDALLFDRSKTKGMRLNIVAVSYTHLTLPTKRIV